MTNNEIMQAWEQHVHLAEHVDSSYKDCVEVSLMKETINLISQLQAENQRLNNCVKSEDEVRAIMKSQMEPMVKEITNEQIDLANKLGRIDGILKFAERLKQSYAFRSGRQIWSRDIDNLVKEMVGEE